MTTSTNRTIPTKADRDAILPALRAIADTTPFNSPQVIPSAYDQSVRIELPLPGTGSHPITIDAHLAYGSEWKVEVSGWSWKVGTVGDLRTTAAVLGVAQSLVALLASLATNR